MVFSSIIFVFQFLPAALILYYLAPGRLKNFVLLIVSLFFYSWGELRYFPVMAALIISNYLAAIFINKFADKRGLKRFFLILSIAVSIGMLFVFKYYNFFAESINSVFSVNIPQLGLSLPLGISFYTFQTLSYTIDVYRGKAEVQKNPINLGAYVVMFPQLIAGPIVRYTDVNAELKNRRVTPENLESGMEDFIIGLAKKVLIANNVGMLWSEVEEMGFGVVSSGLAWLGILAFALQIYFDFSGYSQMAIGMGKMLGFNFPKNFDLPYMSRSVTEFWRRWHMTLGSWFREYLYFPLGGSKKGNRRTTLNLFIVWALTGFWHGASWNFLLWGIYFFILLVIEKSGYISFLNRHALFSHLYMIAVILFGWVLFAITDFSALLEFSKRLFVPTVFSGESYFVGPVYYLRNYAAVLIAGCFFSTSLSVKIYSSVRKKRAVKIILMSLLFIAETAYMVDSTFNPFIYFRF